jgi:hypothetical protein
MGGPLMSLKHTVLILPLLLLLTAYPMWRGKGGFIDRAMLKDMKERNNNKPLTIQQLLNLCEDEEEEEDRLKCQENIRNLCKEGDDCR